MTDPSQLETFKNAYEGAVRVKAAEAFDVSEYQLTPQHIADFESSIIPMARASILTGVRQGHTYWPKVVEESGVQPAMTVTFRAGRIDDKNARIRSYTYISVADIPKLALAAQKFNAPEGAVPLQRIAEVLHVAPAFIQDVIKDEGIDVDTFRNPELEEFDAYLTKNNVLALFLAIRTRQQ